EHLYLCRPFLRPYLIRVFWWQNGHFFIFIGKKSLKALYGNACSDFYQPKCPLTRYFLRTKKTFAKIP
ncbi:hypothetical protein, partial [Neisseria dentiae]|uniref:hypothetical protein n=1 Tax=Neisseria dentiae TaxID=194197 RepID=UPI00359F655E